ncbi:MAG TPA: hypothetical protein VN639_18125 [Azonexus sp.]|nr:hypothetical protein [Azonexus sp.]
MKTLITALLIALSTILTGCVVYDTPHHDGGYRGDRDGMHRGDHDRDHDGVPNRRDSRPDDPRRY